MNLFGVLTGLITLLIIGLGFPLVIFTERRLGYLWWPYLMGLGALFVLVSLLFTNDWLSVFMGLLGTSFVWGSTELKVQSRRAALGWFASHAKKIRPPFADAIQKWPAPHL